MVTLAVLLGRGLEGRESRLEAAAGAAPAAWAVANVFSRLRVDWGLWMIVSSFVVPMAAVPAWRMRQFRLRATPGGGAVAGIACLAGLAIVIPCSRGASIEGASAATVRLEIVTVKPDDGRLRK
ncbi:MAG: hypothetical protein ACREIA_13465 [Opitutaceae bacterium]